MFKRNVIVGVLSLASSIGLYFWLSWVAANMPFAKFHVPDELWVSCLAVAVVSAALFLVFSAAVSVAGKFATSRQALVAIAAFVGSYVFLVVVFALVFAFLQTTENGQAFGTESHVTLLDLLYFSAVTAATIGYGDFTPKTGPAKTAAILESIMCIILIGVYLGSVSGLLSSSDKRKSD
jgi:hypothetical protein